MKIINNNIKIVVWDLDDTFWKGTASEGEISVVVENINIVKELTNRGIINSISSKNDYEKIKFELEKIGIWDYFIFPQISWDPKGKVIKDLLEILNLREDNALFIDDNIFNLNEAIFYLPNLNVCLPNYLPNILENEFLLGKNDQKHTRLKQYKNLEIKQIEFSNSKLSNIDFLKKSNIKVEIKSDCAKEIKRIHELVERTNQLNYTKLRVSIDELSNQINDKDSKSGYILVKDNYGDYGISGFYLIKESRLVHFLFSCRIMNMFIETWVYQKLGRPELAILGDVAMQLDLTVDVSFINNEQVTWENKNENIIKSDKDILIMGGCDLDQIVFYLNYNKIETEFNYVNNINLNVHKDHTYLIKQFYNLNQFQLEVLNHIPVLNVKDTKLKLHSSKWDIFIFSTLNDYSRGLYKHRETGFILPFDAFNINWTDERNWNKLPLHLQSIPKEFLLFLRDNFIFLGPISPSQFIDNIKWLVELYKERKFIFLNWSEVDFSKGKYWEKDMHLRHILMNEALNYFKTYDNVRVVDVSKIVKDENDVTDNIRHYNKLMYKKISDEIQRVSSDWLANKLKIKSSFQIKYDKYIKKVRQKIKN